jgi:hypothetical protein
MYTEALPTKSAIAPSQEPRSSHKGIEHEAGNCVAMALTAAVTLAVGRLSVDDLI